ncbi:MULTISPECIES: hypothetical protein [unclassified Streptomyces]|uniref:hypothetical protein n=1 Tax=unclassified Streptomyces TaxID=2593676 RepID=UPI0013A6B57D|nr:MULTISPECIES: hypothetical protein [unclassified Streptomyces]QZZ29658.1 hypothetical protein A7X85_28495 [Streptomyces sp. ST1015]
MTRTTQKVKEVAMMLCSTTLVVPDELKEAALNYPDGRPDEEPIPDYVTCELDKHKYGTHTCLLRDLSAKASGSVWITWSDPQNVKVEQLPYCVSRGPEKGDACWLTEGHRGGHSWERYE